MRLTTKRVSTLGGVNTRALLSQVTVTPDDLGRNIMAFDGIPIITSDFLESEAPDTGVTKGSIRTTSTASTKTYSVFLIRPGSVMDGGLSFLMGNINPSVESIFQVVEFADPRGLRLWGI